MLREPHMGATRLAISPPRARREDVVDVGQAVAISIHAPAKSATLSCC